MQRATGLAVEFISSRDGVTQGSLAAWLNGNTEKHNRGRHDDMKSSILQVVQQVYAVSDCAKDIRKGSVCAQGHWRSGAVVGKV